MEEHPQFNNHFGLKINDVWSCSVCNAFLFSFFYKVCNDIHFLKRHEGESVVLPCETEPGNPEPFGVYLKRDWLHPTEVLFMYTKEEFKVCNDADKNRTSVSGDPSLHLLNVTISQLKASDTDRYYCEFVVENCSSKDNKIPGKMKFFLLVGAGDYFFSLTYTMMSHLEAPVYEEMVGMKPPGQTQPPVHLEEHIIDLNLL
uniref:Immunoglobulin V-set domain-containing protein n=1 Tax=Amphilophus citrinellus TaxID=61819 RepID=A0A3Q0R9V0_AMPCI